MTEAKSLNAIVNMKKISKAYGPVQALDDVELSLYPGEVVALMGENGAGKSTLMNILSGSTQEDTGIIEIDQVVTPIRSPLVAQQVGISKIHQELQIVPELNVAENIFLGRWPQNKLGQVNFKQMKEDARVLIKQLDWEINPDRKMKDLRIGEQQLVEIAKALALNSRVIIMDEPTSALSETEADRLFTVIRRLKDEGKSVVYITHRMDEVFRIADRLVVLRDGRNAGEKMTKDSSNAEIIKMMVGRSMENQYPKRDVSIGGVVLELKDLNYKPAANSFRRPLKDISLRVNSGEVLGVAGLAGAGRSELLESLAGRFGRQVTAEISIDNKAIKINTPEEAIRSGIILATEDRKGTGLVLGRSIGENLSLPLLKKYSRLGVMNGSRERKDWKEYMAKLRVKAPSSRSLVSSLSGGNQQKVVLARCLLTEPKVLLLDEPTRGIDVGAKEEIYIIINQLAEQGLAVIVVSSELPELIGISDRIVVLCEGELTGEFETHTVSQEMILHSATRQDESHA